MDDTFTRVKKILSVKMNIDPNIIMEESYFVDDLGIDSIDSVECIMAFEKEFKIDIPDEVSDGFHTVGDLVKYIESITSGTGGL